jgi:NodT family efflux transporter outer membrane factor (OMF) lipoprotein
MTSCGLHKSYHRPDIKTDGIYRDVAATDSTNFGDMDWRELFTDVYLQELIDRGLNNNTDLKLASLRVEQAGAALTAARLAFLPSFSLPLQGVVSSFDGGVAVKTYSLPVAATWEIDIFGRIHNAKKRMKAAYEQSEEYKRAVRTQLIAGIANTYYTLLLLDSQHEVSQKTALNWKENVRVMRELKKAGMANETAVSQSEANYFAIEAALFDLKRQIYEVENSLSVILGDKPEVIKRGKLEEQSFTSDLSAGVPLQLLSNRPDVKMAELALQQAFYATNEARSAFYPSLVLTGSGGWTNTVGNNVIDPGKLLLSAVGSLTQPLFSKGANRARLKISKAQQEEALQNFRQSLLNAGSEVINALKQIETAGNKASFRQQQIASLEMATTSSESLMRHGSSTYLEVLIAQQALLSAQITRTNDRFEEIQGLINLYRALGGGKERK